MPWVLIRSLTVSMHPRNVGSDKIVRKNVRPPLYVSLGEAVHFKHPCILVVNHMATWTFREKKQQHSWVWFFNLILMYTLTWITEKELELELKNIKQRRRILLQGNFIVVVRKLEMLAATKVKMSNSKKMQTNKQTKAHATLISPIKHVTRKFRVVVMKKKSGKEMYKKVCCTSKVVFFAN